jgi:cysteinyl-tRNA synthetase
MNITHMNDKNIHNAAEQRMPIKEYPAKITSVFKEVSKTPGRDTLG